MMAVRREILYEVFIDLRKSYYALDRELCMEIFVVYEVGPQTERLLLHYCEHLTMMDRVG